MKIPEPFKHLSWHRLQLTLNGTSASKNNRKNAVEVFQAIIEAVSFKLFPGKLSDDRFLVLFHFTGRVFDFRWKKDEALDVEVSFFQADREEVEQWRQELVKYFEEPVHCRTFSLKSYGDVEQRNMETLLNEPRAKALLEVLEKDHNGICLEFLCPLPFKPIAGRSRRFLTEKAFIRAFETRFEKLFQTRFSIESKRFSLLSYYWNYNEHRHRSRSEKGQTQYINGCMGKLYIKGDISGLLPFLLLGLEVHVGSKRSNSQGYYIIHETPPPLLDSPFPDAGELDRFIDDLSNRSDHMMETIATETYPACLIHDMAPFWKTPSPTSEFEHPLPGAPMIEHWQPIGLVVSQYLAKTLSDAFEAMIPLDSIGSRKGGSGALDRITTVVQEGYLFFMETHIDNFFPTVDHSVLEGRLESLLPPDGGFLKDLLRGFMRTPYLLDGHTQTSLRTAGLPGGNPLSPLLLDLYLDAFNEEVRAMGIPVIRHRDHVFIFFPTREEAQHLMESTVLARLGLTPENAPIRAVGDGLHIRGRVFTPGGVVRVDDFAPDMFMRPLVVSQPYCRLSLDFDRLTVRHQGGVIDQVPLVRVSEIIVMENTILTSALLKRCKELQIPITITLSNGYYMTTIAPSGKTFYALSFRHGAAYAALSPPELLKAAREIALAKLSGHESSFYDRIHRTTSLKDLHRILKTAEKELYRALNQSIDNPYFHIKKPGRKFPAPINSLLNLGNDLLFSRLNTLIRTMGLNPYLGFLHSPNETQESLVLDLRELLSPTLQAFIIQLLNSNQITEEHFIKSTKGYYLTRPGAHIFLTQFESIFRETLYIQVDILRQWALGKQPLTFYCKN